MTVSVAEFKCLDAAGAGAHVVIERCDVQDANIASPSSFQTRITSEAEFDRIESAARTLSKNTLVAGTEVTATLTRGGPPMSGSQGTQRLAALAETIYRELGRELRLSGTGGAADANFAAAVGTPTLDGFGPVGEHLHTAEEYIDVETIVPRIYLLARMLMEVGRRP